jgi:hypothetical protein
VGERGASHTALLEETTQGNQIICVILIPILTFDGVQNSTKTVVQPPQARAGWITGCGRGGASIFYCSELLVSLAE